MNRAEVLSDEQIARMLRQVESVVPESFRHAWSLSAGDVALALREVVAHRAALAAQEGERGGAEEPWPFGAEQAARLIASVSWPNEREENRDGWAVRMLTDRADLLQIEAPRARARLESAIRAVRDRIEAQP